MRKFGFVLLGFTALVLAGSIARADMMDDQNDNKKFSIHGEVRFRAEVWNNATDFTDTTSFGTFPGQGYSNSAFGGTNDSFDLWPYRVRLAAKGDLGNDIWVYGEFQGAGVSGGGLYGETQPFFGDDTETLNGGVHLYQGWVKAKDVGNTVLDLKFGRQEIVFDTGLQFSSLNFYNGIHHDAVRATWDWDNFRIDGFWMKNFESNQAAGVILPFDNADDQTFGAHAEHMIGADKDQHVSYYVIGNQMRGLYDSASATMYTVGARYARDLTDDNGFVWNAEAAYQFGDWQPCASMSTGFTAAFDVFAGPVTFPCPDNFDQKAYVFEGMFGYNWHDGSTNQRVWGGVNYASGDKDPNDTDMKQYMPLYTDFHNRLGYADLFAESNITAYSIGYNLNLDNKHLFGATLYQFNKTEKEAPVYSPLGVGSQQNSTTNLVFNLLTISGCTNPPPGESCSDDLGQELDLTYGYNMTSNFGFDVALSYFSPGDAIKNQISSYGFYNAGDDNAMRLTGQARARW